MNEFEGSKRKAEYIKLPITNNQIKSFKLGFLLLIKSPILIILH